MTLIPPQSLPKTSSGKIRRAAAKQAWLQGGFQAPRWTRVLRFAARAAIERLRDMARRATRRAMEAAYGVWVRAEVYWTYVPVWVLCSTRVDRRSACAAARAWSRLATRLAGLQPRVAGVEHLEGPGPRVVVCNHASYLDTLLLAWVLPGAPRFVAKSELLRDPFQGPLAVATGSYFVRRDDPQGGVEDQARIEAGLDQGETVVFFPEGTFTSSTGLRPFRLGAFQAAVAARAEVVPVAIRGARDVLRGDTLLPRPGRIEIQVGPPIRPEGDGWREIVRLRDEARAWIAAHCGEPVLDTVDAGLSRPPSSSE